MESILLRFREKVMLVRLTIITYFANRNMLRMLVLNELSNKSGRRSLLRHVLCMVHSLALDHSWVDLWNHHLYSTNINWTFISDFKLVYTCVIHFIGYTLQIELMNHFDIIIEWFYSLKIKIMFKFLNVNIFLVY